MTRWSAITRTRAHRSALAYGSRSTTGAETTSTGSYTTSGDATLGAPADTHAASCPDLRVTAPMNQAPRIPTLDDVGAAQERIAPYLSPTPLYRYDDLTELIGTEIWVKHENHQPVGAFKV